MKEEAQGFPTACGSMGFRLNPKALGVSEKVTFLGKSKLTMGILVLCRSPSGRYGPFSRGLARLDS